jgi:hypothetical protein
MSVLPPSPEKQPPAVAVQTTMSQHPRRPRDLNQWAKRMTDVMTDVVSGAVQNRERTPEEQGKDPALA